MKDLNAARAIVDVNAALTRKGFTLGVAITSVRAQWAQGSQADEPVWVLGERGLGSLLIGALPARAYGPDPACCLRVKRGEHSTVQRAVARTAFRTPREVAVFFMVAKLYAGALS
jgi:hypothetical protein